MNLTALTFLALTAAPAQPPADVQATKSRTHQFNVAYDKKQKNEIQQLQLCVSQDKGQSYQVMDAVTVDKDHLVFRAPDDGLYWVNMVIVFRDGRRDPADVSRVAPAVKMLVDSTAPVVRIAAAQRAGDEVAVEWTVDDKFPNDAATQVVYKPTGPAATGDWQPVPPAAVSGRTARFKPGVTGPISVQVVAQDLAGNAGTAIREVPAGVTASYLSPAAPATPVGGPALGPTPGPVVVGTPAVEPRLPPAGASVSGPSGGGPVAPAIIPQPAPGVPGPVAAATDFGTPITPVTPPPAPVFPSAAPPTMPTPPAVNPAPSITAPAGLPLSAPPAGPSTFPSTVSPTDPLPTTTPSPSAPPGMTPLPVTTDAPAQKPFSPAEVQPAAVSNAAQPELPSNVQYVKTPRFDLQYQMENGPSGLSRIDLYVTRDEGRTWAKWSSHDGRESPLKVNLSTPFNTQRQGEYGFRLVPVSGAGVADDAPTAGAAADLRVYLDETPPLIRPFQPTADPVQRNVLVLNWEATDANFGKDPIAIEWAEQPSGPWRSVTGDAVPPPTAGGGDPGLAGRLPNTGRYSWQLPAAMTTHRVYLKFTAWDAAGNKNVVVTQAPVTIDLTKPRARIQGIAAAASGPRR